LLLQHIEGARALAHAGHLAFGTMDSWLVWQLTQGALHISDVSNASRTGLLNIHSLQWDSELLTLYNIPSTLLPQIVSSSECYGHSTLFDTPIVISGIAGDQQAALFGQRCWQQGMVKNTYGTGCFMLMNIGSQPVQSAHQLLTTVAWRIGNQTHYALEGSVFMAGALVQWLRDGLALIQTAQDIEALAAQVLDSAGVVIVPAFTGLGAPYWQANARGSIFGLTRGSTPAHIARAALQAIAWQADDVLKAMSADAGVPITQLRVDGGATANALLMQIQADILGVPVLRPPHAEATALGAAYLAGLAVGFWRDLAGIQALSCNHSRYEYVFTPQANQTEVLATQKQAWGRAVRATLAWAADQ
jgi:glycerol kinase